MNKPNRRQFIKTYTAAGLVGLIAPSFVLSSFTNTKSEVVLIIGEVKVSLRLVYWDESKTWRPLELVQDGNTVKSEGLVKVTFSFIDEGQYLTYNLDVQSPEPTRIGMFVSLPGTTSETPVYHVLPGLLFGDNNLANVLDKNAFHHLTNEPFEGKALSPVWEFRADRCAMSLSAMCSEKAIIAISIDPYAESKSEELTTVACGVTSMLANNVAPSSCGVTLGYANLPYTYEYQGAFTAPKEETLLSGKVSGRIYAEATGDRRSVNRFVQKEYEYRRALPKIKVTRNEALIACATAMRDVLWSPKDKAFCNLYFDNGATHGKDARKRILKEIGWCGGPSIALPAIQAGLYLNDKDLIQHGLDTCNVVPTLLNPKSGLLYDNGMTGDKDVNGWWTGRSGRDKHFAYTNGSCISDLMSVAKVLDDAGMDVPEAWYKVTTTVLDTIASLQLKDGNLGFAYSMKRPKMIDPHGAIGAWWIPGFALASKRLNKPHYMNVARRALEYYHQFYIDLDVNGASMDTGKSPNEESAHAFIRAARILHELTGDDYYLEALRDGIDLECLWRYGYATKPLVPPLSNSGWNSCGGSVTSVANPCIHPMGIRVSDDLRYYAKITGDKYVYKRWEDGINWSIASLELYPKYTGIGPFGITSERYCQSDGMLYPNFDGGELWSIWNTSHCFGVAAMLEGLVDAVQLKD